MGLLACIDGGNVGPKSSLKTVLHSIMAYLRAAGLVLDGLVFLAHEATLAASHLSNFFFAPHELHQLIQRVRWQLQRVQDPEQHFLDALKFRPGPVLASLLICTPTTAALRDANMAIFQGLRQLLICFWSRSKLELAFLFDFTVADSMPTLLVCEKGVFDMICKP